MTYRSTRSKHRHMTRAGSTNRLYSQTRCGLKSTRKIISQFATPCLFCCSRTMWASEVSCWFDGVGWKKNTLAESWDSNDKAKYWSGLMKVNRRVHFLLSHWESSRLVLLDKHSHAAYPNAPNLVSQNIQYYCCHLPETGKTTTESYVHLLHITEISPIWHCLFIVDLMNARNSFGFNQRFFLIS